MPPQLALLTSPRLEEFTIHPCLSFISIFVVMTSLARTRRRQDVKKAKIQKPAGDMLCQ